MEPITQPACPNRAQPVAASGWLAHFPVALFASVMGLAGLSLAWTKAAHVLGLPGVAGDALRWLATAVWCALLGVYAAKWLRHPQAVRAERAHPVKLNFLPAISIGLLLLSVAWAPAAPTLSNALWIAGATAHLLFTVLAMHVWLFQSAFQIQHVTAAWFIPVVGNIIVPLGGVHHAPVDISWFFFSIGVVFWLMLFTIVLYRLFFHGPLPPKLQPTLFILIAPPAVGFLAYGALTGGLIDAFSRVLYFTALFLTMLLAVHARRYLRTPFALPAWAYSFPLAAITIATLEMGRLSTQPFYSGLGVLLLAVTSAVVAWLVIKTLLAMAQGQVFIPE